MGHRQNLSVLPELLHQAAHGLCHRTAYAGIYLVKNQGLRCAKLAGGHCNGQCHARQLAARGDFIDRPRRASRMSGYQKKHVLQAVLHRLGRRLQRHLKLPALHAQALHRPGDCLGQLRRGFGPGL